MALGPSSRSAPPSVARLTPWASASRCSSPSQSDVVCQIAADVFGLPVVLNPTYFIPFVLNIPVCAIVVQALYALGLGAAFNPTIQLPWVLPQPVIAFMQGGIGCLVISVAVLAVSVLMYTPFTLMADRQALREEQAALEESAA